MPDPVVGPPVQNADGTTSVTTTTFYDDGTKKEVKTETRDRRGTLKKEETDKFDDQGRLDEKTETKYKNGKKEKETTEKFDDQGRLDERTETTYEKDGRKKKKETTSKYDDDGRETSTETTSFEKGRTKAKGTATTDYNARPPRREVVEIAYCPDGERIRIRRTRVSYNRAGSWQEEQREEKLEKFDCATGRQVSSGFPGTGGDYALLLFALAGAGLAVTGWMDQSNPHWVGAAACLIVSALLYGERRARSCSAVRELLDAMATLYDGEDEGPSQTGNGAPPAEPVEAAD